MVVDLTKPRFEPEMTGREMKILRIKLGLSALELGRAFGFTTSDAVCQQAIHRYESGTGGREIPPWLARLGKMFEAHGIPEGWLERKQPIDETETTDEHG